MSLVPQGIIRHRSITASSHTPSKYVCISYERQKGTSRRVAKIRDASKFGRPAALRAGQVGLEVAGVHSHVIDAQNRDVLLMDWSA